VVDFNGEVIPCIYCVGEPANYLAFSTLHRFHRRSYFFVGFTGRHKFGRSDLDSPQARAQRMTQNKGSITAGLLHAWMKI